MTLVILRQDMAASSSRFVTGDVSSDRIQGIDDITETIRENKQCDLGGKHGDKDDELTKYRDLVTINGVEHQLMRSAI